MNRRDVLAGILLGCLSLAGCTGREELRARGELAVVVNGTPVDLTADRFQAEHAENHSLAFHLHQGDEYWYMEGERRVTFAEGIDHLPHFAYEREDGHHVVTIDGETYDGGDPDTEVHFAVDGEPVDPTAHELHDGDELLVEVEIDR